MPTAPAGEAGLFWPGAAGVLFEGHQAQFDGVFALSVPKMGHQARSVWAVYPTPCRAGSRIRARPLRR